MHNTYIYTTFTLIVRRLHPVVTPKNDSADSFVGFHAHHHHPRPCQHSPRQAPPVQDAYVHAHATTHVAHQGSTTAYPFVSGTSQIDGRREPPRFFLFWALYVLWSWWTPTLPAPTHCRPNKVSCMQRLRRGGKVVFETIFTVPILSADSLYQTEVNASRCVFIKATAISKHDTPSTPNVYTII